MKTGELPIKSPCDADWTTMNPRQKGRFCGDCKKVVHDLSSLREADAKKRVAEAPEGLCIRYLHDEHGNIWFQDTSLVSPGSLFRKGASLAALALMPMLTACMGSALATDEPGLAASPPDASSEPDAGSDARKAADPVIESDAAPDAEESDPDAGQ